MSRVGVGEPQGQANPLSSLVLWAMVAKSSLGPDPVIAFILFPTA